jgi:hypothetical protein
MSRDCLQHVSSLCGSDIARAKSIACSHGIELQINDHLLPAVRLHSTASIAEWLNFAAA